MGNLPSAEELIARGETPVRDSITGHTISVTLCERENFLLTWRKHERKLPVDSPWSDHAAIVAYITDNGTVSTVRILNSEREESKQWLNHICHSLKYQKKQVRQPFLHNETLWKGKSPPPRTGWGGPSLDHSIHFHRRFRCDEWHLYVQRTDITDGGRGLADIKILTNDGKIVASCSQEALMRIPRSSL